MIFKYLGTAAAESVPSPFCFCDVCRTARKLGGKEIRTLSQGLVDGKILLDFGADTVMHCNAYGFDFETVRSCLITHIHEDHLYHEQLFNLKKGFAFVPDDVPPFTVYGSADVNTMLGKYVERCAGRLKIEVVKPFEPFLVDGHTVTALRAIHGTENPYIYIISDGQKTMLYANDTGGIHPDTAEYLKSTKPHFDFVSLDCTGGSNEDLRYSSHMCLGRNIKMRDQLFEMGICDEKTLFVLNHFSHNGKDVLYKDLSKIVKKHGFSVSYDGMTVKL